MKRRILAGMLLAVVASAAHAQEVHVTTGNQVIIPYVVSDPDALVVGAQVTADHDAGLVLGLARNVVLPTDTAVGNYAGSTDHDGHFVALMYGAPATEGVLPISILARRPGTYALRVMLCSVGTAVGAVATCDRSVTTIVAEGDAVRIR